MFKIILIIFKTIVKLHLFLFPGGRGEKYGRKALKDT